MKFKLLLLGLSLVISLLLCEVLLRSLKLPRTLEPHTKPKQFRFSLTPDGLFYYTNLPGGVITFRYDGNPRSYFDENDEIHHSVNSSGFRGKEFQLDKPLDKKRIAFLGDSFTFGEGVKDQDIFSGRVAKKLNSQDGQYKYEALNFGVGGYNTEQSVELLQKIVLQYQPDMVILSHTLNDIEPKLFYLDKETFEPKRREREKRVAEGVSIDTIDDSFLSHFNLYRLIAKSYHSLTASRKTIQYYKDMYADPKLWQKQQQSVQEYFRLCELHDIDCYLAILPLFYNLEGKYPFHSLHKQVEDVVKDKSKVINTVPRFLGKNGQDFWVHPTDQHPNELAHAMIAEEIVGYLGNYAD